MSINLKGAWELRDINIDEVSLVVAGDNPNARMLIAKSAPTALSDEAYIDLFLTEVAEVEKKALPSLERVPGVQNWVDRAGGLPDYINKIAKHLHYERGMDIGRAIASAVHTVKVWAAGGGGVKADTRAKAAQAVAEWEAKKNIGRGEHIAKAFTAGPGAPTAPTAPTVDLAAGPGSGSTSDPARLPSGQVDAPDTGASPIESPEEQDPSMSVPAEATATVTPEVTDAELEAVANDATEVEKSGDAVAAKNRLDNKTGEEGTPEEEATEPAAEAAAEGDPALSVPDMQATDTQAPVALDAPVAADAPAAVDAPVEGSPEEEAAESPEDEAAEGPDTDSDDINWDDFGLPTEVVEYIKATEDANAALTEENASLKANAAAPVSVEKSAEQIIIEKADPAIRAIIEKAQRERAEAEEIAKAATNEAETRAYIEKAAPFTSLGTPEEMGGYLRAIDTHLPEAVAKGLTERLTALAAQVSKSALFTEQGSEAPATGESSLDAAANAVMAADPSLTREQAVTKAVSSNPSLYTAYTDEESN